MNKKYNIAAAIFGVVLIFGIFIYKQNFSGVIPKPTILQENEAVSEIDVSVLVDFADQRASDSGKVKIETGENALEVLKRAHNVETKHYSFGDLVQSIDGVSGENGKYWIYYVNGKKASEGASVYLPKNGDKIEWKLENQK